MTPPLGATRVLNLEDSDLDAALIEEHLRRAGIAHETQRVWDKAAYLAALEAGDFDLILADYRLPSFDGLSALELARSHAPDVPFIFVSATLGEEVAIEALKKGATDYVIKSRLGRLGSCVARALREGKERRTREFAEEESINTRRRLSAALSVAEIGTFEWILSDDTVILDERSLEILGLDGAAVRLMEEFKSIIAPGDFARVREAAYAGRGGDWFGVEGGSNERGIGVLQDVTDQKSTRERQAIVVRELHHRVKNSLAIVASLLALQARAAEDPAVHDGDELVPGFGVDAAGRAARGIGRDVVLHRREVRQPRRDHLDALPPFGEPPARVAVDRASDDEQPGDRGGLHAQGHGSRLVPNQWSRQSGEQVPDKGGEGRRHQEVGQAQGRQGPLRRT